MSLLKTEHPAHYAAPKFSDFPQAEWRQRVRKAQTLMRNNGLDCLPLWSRENIYYFSSFRTTHWWLPSLQPAILILFADREPIIIVPNLLRGLAEATSWVREIWLVEKPHESPAQRALPKDIANLIKDFGYGRKNIGMETGPIGHIWIPRPLCDIEMFKNSLPDATFLDGEQVYWGCRMVKSAFEIDRIKKSVEGIRAIQSALVEEFRPGMTEVELSRIVHIKAAEIEGAFIGDNAFGVKGSFGCSLEREAVADCGPFDGITINKGDYIKFDMAFTYKGYLADNARIFQTGPITDEIKKKYELLWRAQDQGAEILKPGIRANDLYYAITNPLKQAGLPLLDVVGHGVGLINHEPPMLDASNTMIIEEGMTLSLEPWIYGSYKYKGGSGTFGLQDTFVVTENGCHKFEGLRRDIVQVTHTFGN